MGTTQFQYVAYAQFANSVDAENIIGVVPVARGGTGTNSLPNFKTALALDKVNNTSDLNKPISTATQTALDLKLNSADTVKFIKQTYVDSALVTKLSITGNAATATSATTATTATSAGTAATATKLATARNINGVAFDGSGDITITATADAGTLTGNTLKSTVTGSSLTSVGTLANLTVTNPIVGSITGNAATATTASTVITNANLTGDITSVGNATTIADNAVATSKVLNANITYAKIQNISSTDKVLGRVSSGAGVVEEIATTVLAV